MVFAAAGLAVFVYLPFLPADAPYRAHPWHGVLLRDLSETYLLTISPIILILLTLCALVWVIAPKIDGTDPTVGFRRHELIAIAVLYFIPVVAFGIARLFTHTYVARYSVMFSIAASITVGILVYSLTRTVRGLAPAALIVLLMCAGLPVAKGFVHPDEQNTGDITRSRLSILDTLPLLPVAVTNFNDYGRIYLFGPDQLKQRVILVSDPSAITEFGNNLGLATEALQRALNAPAEHYNEFVRSHSQFLLLGNYLARDRLLRDGWKIILLGRVFYWDLYCVTRLKEKPTPPA